MNIFTKTFTPLSEQEERSLPLTQDAFNQVSSDPDFIDLLRRQYFAFTLMNGIGGQGSVIYTPSDETLTKKYYLSTIKDPEELTDSDCFLIDPKGDFDVTRRWLVTLRSSCPTKKLFRAGAL